MSDSERLVEMLNAYAGVVAMFTMIRAIERAADVPPRDPRRDRIWNGSGYAVRRRDDGLRSLRWLLDGGPAELVEAISDH